MSKFLSGRIGKLLVGIVGYTENKTVVQTTGKVGIGTTNAQQNSLYVVGDTNITGDTNVGGALTVSQATVKDLTDNRVVVAGTGGRLEDSAGLTFDGSTLAVDGDLQITGVLTYDDVTSIDSIGIVTARKGLHVLSNGVDVTGVSTFSDDVDFVGNPTGIAQTSIQFHKGDGTNSDLDALNLYDRATINLGVGQAGSLSLRGDYAGGSYIFGFGTQLRIDGSSLNSTKLRLRTNDVRDGIVVNPGGGSNSGAVELYHSTSANVASDKRFETTGYGATVYNDLRVGTAVTVYGNAGIVSAISFYGDGANLTNTGATLNAVSGTERLVTTQLTSGTMVDAATDADLTFRASDNLLSTPNIAISGGISTDGYDTGNQFELMRADGNGGWSWASVPGIFSVNNILNGFNVREEGLIVGTAGSIHTLDFHGLNVTASADPQPNGIATITMSPTPTFEELYVVGVTSTNNLRVTGVSTFTGAIDANGNLDVDGTTELDVLNVAETATFSSNIDANADVDIAGTLDVDGHTLLDNVSISGVTTTSGLLDINAGGQANTFKVEDLTSGRVVLAGTGGELEDSGNLTFDGSTLSVTGDLSVSGTLSYDDVTNIDSIGIITARNGLHVLSDGVNIAGLSTFTGRIVGAATSNVIPFLYANLSDLPSASTYHGAFAHVHATGRAYYAHAANWYELVNKELNGDLIVGTGITMYANTGIVSATAFYGDGSNLLNTGATLNAATGTQRLVLTGLTSGTMVDAATDSDLAYNASDDRLIVANLDISGITTLGGPVTAGSSEGAVGQYLRHVGTGVTWANFPTLRTTSTNTATAGQTTFNFTYNTNFLDVFVNGVKLSPSEYTATNGSQIILNTAAFADEIVEFHSYNTASTYGGGGGSSYGNSDVDNHLNVSGASSGQILSWNGSDYAWVADQTGGSGITTAIINADTIDSGSLNVSGVSTFTGNVSFASSALFGDSDKILLGADDDFEIYHDGSNGYIDNATGELYIRDTNASGTNRIFIQPKSGENGIIAYEDGQVELYHNNSKRFETTSTGVSISGNIDTVTDISCNSIANNAGGGATWTLNNTGNATFTGTVTANTFSGSGSSLTGLTGASAATYGNGTAVPQITVDANGRITGITNVSISGGGGGGGTSMFIRDNGSLVGAAGTIDFGTGLSVSPVSAGIVTVTTAGISTAIINADTIDSGSVNVSGISTFGDIKIEDDTIRSTGQINLITNGSSFDLDINTTDAISAGGQGVSQYVRLYGAGSEKLKTVGSGVTVTGTTFSNKLSISGQVSVAGVSTFVGKTEFTTNNVVLTSTNQLRFGAAENTFLYYGTDANSYLQTSLNEFRIGAPTLRLQSYSSVGYPGEDYLVATKDGSVDIYYNNVKKFETTNTGVTITGTASATTFSGSGASLTTLNASELDSGTIPDARFPATLPAVSGANLTNLPAPTPADTDVQVTYDVSSNGSSAYRFTGPGYSGADDNPDIYLVRGQRYRFINGTGSSHPFRIQSDTSGTAYTDGVSGSQSGTQDFNVQHDAPARLYYQCTIHSGMIGNIYVVGGSDWRMTDVATNATPEIFTNLNVGIGTDNPHHELHIQGSGDTRALITSGGTGDAAMMFENASGNTWGHGIDLTNNNYVVAYNGTSDPSLTTDGKFEITGSGNVAIGHANPDSRLHLYSTSNHVATFEYSSTSDVAIQLKNTQGSMYFGLGGGEEFAISTDADLNGSNMRFSVDQNGAVRTPDQPAALVYKTGTSQNFTADAIVNYDATSYSQGGMTINANRNRITVPVAGKYMINASISGSVTTVSAGDGWKLRILRDGSVYNHTYGFPIETTGSETGQELAYTLSMVVDAAANDYFEIEIENVGTARASMSYGYFGIYLLG